MTTVVVVVVVVVAVVVVVLVLEEEVEEEEEKKIRMRDTSLQGACSRRSWLSAPAALHANSKEQW